MLTYTLTPGVDIGSFLMVIYRDGEEIASTIISGSRLRQARPIAKSILDRYRELLEHASE